MLMLICYLIMHFYLQAPKGNRYFLFSLTGSLVHLYPRLQLQPNSDKMKKNKKKNPFKHEEETEDNDIIYTTVFFFSETQCSQMYKRLVAQQLAGQPAAILGHN